MHVNPPVVDGALLLVTATASDASTLSAFDPVGRRSWTVVPGGQVPDGANVATVPGQTVYVSTTVLLSGGGGFVLLRGYAIENGAVQTSVVVSIALPVLSLATANGLVYGTFFTAFGRDSTTGTFAVDPDTGTVAWTGQLFTLAVTPGAVLSNNPRTGTLNAYHPITGAVRWTTSQTDFSAVATDHLVFFREGTIRRLSDGDVVGRVKTDGGRAPARYALRRSGLRLLGRPRSTPRPVSHVGDVAGGVPSAQLDEALEAERVEEVGELHAQPPEPVEHQQQAEEREEPGRDERERAQVALHERERRRPAPEREADEQERHAHAHRVGDEQA